MGESNYDTKTGIHYGVISQHSVMAEALDDLEPDYGPPTCPKCGNEATNIDGYEEDFEEWERAKYDDEQYLCPGCKYVFGSESAYSEEPNGFTYEEDGYILTNCLDSDIFVLKSPYYTFTQYCSPCVPGAGNLDTPIENGVKTYALGHDWYEEGIAPYPVYRVEDDKQIAATREYIDCQWCNGSGKRESTEDNPIANLPIGQTCPCWVCNGIGKRYETIEREE